MASLYVSKYKSGWRVIEEVWKDGARTQKTLPREAFRALGINPEWSLEQARERVKQLNKLSTLERKEQSKKAATARRVVELKELDSVFLPLELTSEFTAKLQSESFGSDAHKNRLLSHFKRIQKLVTKLRLEPSDFSDNSERIFQYFIQSKLSPDYSNKLIRVLNMWGRFVCKKRGQAYEPIESPRGTPRSRIDDAYIESDGFRGESDPLTPEMLESAKKYLPSEENYNWLSLSVWFGLRPNEIDSLKKPGTWRLERDSQHKIEVLWVYQSKLTSIERDKRWKPIPVVFPEQKKALAVIRDGLFKRPTYKTMKQAFPKARITCYGGRKGFIDLMLDRNQKLEDISMWLGHQSIETTWRKYRNKRRVSFTKAG